MNKGFATFLIIVVVFATFIFLVVNTTEKEIERVSIGEQNYVIYKVTGFSRMTEYRTVVWVEKPGVVRRSMKMEFLAKNVIEARKGAEDAFKRHEKMVANLSATKESSLAQYTP